MEDEQLLRYNRHIMLPEFGFEGQQKLNDAHIVIIGLGGLGSPAAVYLAASGIGEITLVDHDTVELSNLQRQIAHTTQNIGEAKVESARKNLLQINPEIKINCIAHKLNGDALESKIAECDLVIDATDNFESRYAINEACFKTQTPLVSGAAIRFEGQVSVYDFRQSDSPCYHCLYPQTDNHSEETTCSENGILAPVVGIIGCIQATEAIKLLADVGEPLTGKLLLLDAKTMEWRTMKFKQDPSCAICGKNS